MDGSADVIRAVDWDAVPAGLDGVAAELRSMRSASGDPSYAEIVRRIARGRASRGVPDHERRIPRSTVYDCFRDGRRRLDVDAVGEIVLALGLPSEAVDRWSRRVRQAQAAAADASITVVLDGAPSPVPYFAGRHPERAALARSLDAPDARIWITGMAGSGKTQLALAATQQIHAAARETGGPDRGLFIDLRGRPVDSSPVDPAAAQRAVLRAVGQDDVGSTRERAERLVDSLREAGRILVLDDAVDEAQIRAIVGSGAGLPSGPGGPGRIVVTSRSRPEADAEGWSLIALEGMGSEDVAAVLENFMRAAQAPGGPGPDAPAELAERLTRVSGGLPLAVALVGGRMATRPEWTLAEHVDLMEDGVAAARLDEELRGALTLSYADLPEEAARLLRVVADLPLAELDMSAAAAALEVSEDRAAELARQLAVRGLAVHRRHGRITLHSLVRASGRSWARGTDPPRVRREAFGRVALQAARRVWHAYAVIAHSMDDVPRKTDFVYPGAGADTDTAPNAGPVTGGGDAEQAGRWLQAELDSLLTLAHAAPEQGHPELLFRLSEGLSWWMNLAGHHNEALRLHEAAADVAVEVADADALAMASLDAGQLLAQRDRPEEALRHFRRATRLVAEAGGLSDPGVLGVILNMTALLEIRRGNLDRAVRDLNRAVAIHRERGEAARQMSALVNLGTALDTAGRFEEEDEVIRCGLELAREHGHGLFIANFLVNRAHLRLSQGRSEEALADADRGVQQAEAVGSPYLMIDGDGTAARALHRLGDRARAFRRSTRALESAETLGNDLTTAEQLVVAAELADGRGLPEEAVTMLDRAEGLLAAASDHVLRGRIWRHRGYLCHEQAERSRWLAAALVELERAGAHEAAVLRAALEEALDGDLEEGAEQRT
ncbi:NB-ARC domain-containing protein [Microbacterium sp. A93]|uniref:NB-ARC domain-containing protein n=1 Tax=Microbacterium sp. A93 TaxID=3450716 RepID=UPI003F42DF84